MKPFIYTNSNRSGIGDRLMDLILVYTYSQYLKCDRLYLHWAEDSNDMTGNNSIHSILRKQKTPFRKKDYLLHNLQKYIACFKTNSINGLVFIDRIGKNKFSKPEILYNVLKSFIY